MKAPNSHKSVPTEEPLSAFHPLASNLKPNWHNMFKARTSQAGTAVRSSSQGLWEVFLKKESGPNMAKERNQGLLKTALLPDSYYTPSLAAGPFPKIWIQLEYLPYSPPKSCKSKTSTTTPTNQPALVNLIGSFPFGGLFTNGRERCRPGPREELGCCPWPPCTVPARSQQQEEVT